MAIHIRKNLLRLMTAYREKTGPYLSSIKYEKASALPVAGKFRVLDEVGAVVKGAEKYAKLLSNEDKMKIFKVMVTTQIMDEILYSAQRQGRISFYMTCSGEEGTVVGSAAALGDTDEVFAQYREQGVLLWRGFTFKEVMSQCCSSVHEPARGRQMPIHYGSKKLHFHTISSPLGTQLPHAVGAAYAMKMANENRISVCYFGDGAASEGDFHAALNFASTLDCPVLFLCRNNGYAISTPTVEQYRGDGVLRRGVGYGIDAIRVDGNDALAVYAAVRDARKKILEFQKPLLIELMTYRGGHHSTSDDSTRYRSKEELTHYADTASPIHRLKLHLFLNKLTTGEDELRFEEQVRLQVRAALEDGEKEPKAGYQDCMTEVYAAPTKSLKYQTNELEEHLATYGTQY
eukprot:Plantae.Rhodophyta-Purpureofilum_apyrenoidigerum.ctg11239.p1 GENE.Plantae.Rhodophyta-Purpureofilum_apyrenoidigerum.ctg11239~~Plantae.Rhodophyta-Purpureofilum_apyrenoidigerum.ctg11239.p1  ORF type:complete len:403 (-),score=70.77 Plantae.Rhodophyta-Purpureofilum_apyrenoidigerum.ctg11239:410-1618(-)